MANADLLIRGARVMDGTGSPWFRGDLLVRGDRIAAVCPAGGASAEAPRTVIDAEGLVLAPGFIDIQSHAIRSVFDDGRCISKISQGITTEIMGETWTPAPVGGQYESPLGEQRGWARFAQWLEAMEAHGVAPNVGSFVAGHTLRRYAMGMQLGAPSREQLQLMQRLVAEAMEDGAFGVAYALIYPPDAYTTTEELIEVCRPAAERGGTYISHLRSEGARYLEALEEAMAIGRATDMPVEVYHLKVCGAANWPKMPEAIARLNAARERGLDIAANMYPYTASGTTLAACLPPWAAADRGLHANLEDASMRQRIQAEAINPSGDWEPQLEIAGVGNVRPVELRRPEHRDYIGRPLDAIAADMGLEPVDAVIELLRREEHRVFTVYHKMTERNVLRQMTEPWVKFSTDAGALDPAAVTVGQAVHPRSYGTMPRILGRYVRELGALTLEQAVSKMTWQVARRLGLGDRGQLRPGAAADLVLFDPERITDRATFEEPHQLSEGVVGVWVNGTRVWDANGHTGARPGRAVRGPGALTSAPV